MDKKKTTIYLSAEDEQMLDALTDNGAKSRAHVIREAIAHYYADTPVDLPVGNLFEDDLQATEIDDWLRTNWKPE